MKFEVTNSGAYRVSGKGFMVSYLAENPNLGIEDSSMLAVLNAMLELSNGGTVNVPSEGETALCLEEIFPTKINAWFLLTGDFICPNCGHPSKQPGHHFPCQTTEWCDLCV